MDCDSVFQIGKNASICACSPHAQIIPYHVGCGIIMSFLCFYSYCNQVGTKFIGDSFPIYET